MLGTRDYLGKNGFTDAVIGLSGGVDSSLVATVAVRRPRGRPRARPGHAVALLERRVGHRRRSPWRSNLGIDLRHRPHRGGPRRARRRSLAGALGDAPSGLTDENLQSRIRGVLLMAVSNARGWIVLTTGQQERAGHRVLHPVRRLGGRLRRHQGRPQDPRLPAVPLPQRPRRDASSIPEAVLTKAPSAELRPDQRDDQSLPPYEVLDPLLEALVVHDRSVAEVVGSGYDPELVVRVARLVDGAEYKRRQSPPGSASRPRRSARIGACPSPTAIATRPPRPRRRRRRRATAPTTGTVPPCLTGSTAAALGVGRRRTPTESPGRGPALPLDGAGPARRVVPVGRAPALRGARRRGWRPSPCPRPRCSSTSTASSTPGTPSCSRTGCRPSTRSTPPPSWCRPSAEVDRMLGVAGRGGARRRCRRPPADLAGRATDRTCRRGHAASPRRRRQGGAAPAGRRVHAASPPGLAVADAPLIAVSAAGAARRDRAVAGHRGPDADPAAASPRRRRGHRPPAAARADHRRIGRRSRAVAGDRPFRRRRSAPSA